MAFHTIEPVEGKLHGTFSKDYAPILTIDPGDTVRFRTLDAHWLLDDLESVANPPKSLEGWGKKFESRVEGRDEGHALGGPIAIRGAQPGMMLSVHIDRLIPGTWGWAYPWFGTPYEQKDILPLVIWKLDPEKMTGTDPRGYTIALHPFMGVMGMPPAEEGIHSTKPPRPMGGNIDCKELVEGSTLYLPISVEGALFSVGDGHAAQGDGEVSGTAIECPMQHVELTFDLVTDRPITTAHANTPRGWLTFGFNEDLNIATQEALEAMLGLMSARLGMTRLEALALAGVVVDLHITQIVNDVQGVHALLPHKALL